MAPIYPLRMQLIYRHYPWGGRKLGELLGKPIGRGPHFAESWEVVDHGDDQSIVAAGPLAGKSLNELVHSHGQALLGRHHPQSDFPLLYKFLDAQRTLSVQVHPDDAMAATLDPPDLGKTEAWYVLAAEPGSVVYAGLKPGVDREALELAIRAGRCEETLHEIPVDVGDCVFLPAGVVHAIGAGLVVAEIQQASDTTFRLYDWNYLGPDGQPRELHIEQGVAATDFTRGPMSPQVPAPTSRSQAERLVECDYFLWDRWTFEEPLDFPCQDACHIISVLEGELSVEGDVAEQPAGKGQTLLLPAELDTVRLTPRGKVVMLDASMP